MKAALVVVVLMIAAVVGWIGVDKVRSWASSPDEVPTTPEKELLSEFERQRAELGKDVERLDEGPDGLPYRVDIACRRVGVMGVQTLETLALIATHSTGRSGHRSRGDLRITFGCIAFVCSLEGCAQLR